MPSNRQPAISLALLSAAIIAFQLVLMRLLSIVQWYHFAYMLISVALLGFGAAGSCLSIFRTRLFRHFDSALPLLMFLCSIAMAAVAAVWQHPAFRFDSYLVFTGSVYAVKLVLTYLLFFTPFFFGALAIGMIFTHYAGSIGSIYFANLLGSGIGGIFVLALFFLFMPERLPASVAVFPALAGGLLITEKQKWLYIPALISAAVTAFFLINPPTLQPSQYKDISKALLLPDAKIELAQCSPHGLLQSVSSPALRYGPGLSLRAAKAPPIERAVFINGDWLGPQIDFANEGLAYMLEHTTMALPFIMRQRDRALFLNAGTGTQVIQALYHESKEITMVESNDAVVKLLRKQLQQADSPDSRRIRLHHTESRNFLMKDKSVYDLITLPMVGAFGGAGGIHAAMEQYLLTVEGFCQMWERLSDEGVISVTCWMDYPPRNPLKLAATLSEALEAKGRHPLPHLAVVRSWSTITFVIKKTPLQQDEIEKLRAFCDSMHFDPALLPGIREEERTRYNQLQDNSFLEYLDAVSSSEREAFCRQYDFNIRPATDNKPYFSQFLRWKSLRKLNEVFSSRLPFFEIGYLIVIITLLQTAMMAFVLIILPLFMLGWRGGRKSWSLFYFGGIGMGYMFVEMVLIQRLTLYFGNPVYAAAASISAMLVFSGIGSYLSGRIAMHRSRMLMIFTVIILLLAVYAFSLTSILQTTIALPLAVKVLLISGLLAPLAVCMGVPFPAGLSLLAKRSESQVPWAWGINGCLSVVSTALATIVAVEWGFVWVMLVAAAGYGMPLLTVINSGKSDR
ncbi:MAG TPA: hypothetical protein VNJ07_00200 [Chitinophagales bacterium]|nr:hypothetical protein [Chitinophagales bacterium]